MSTREPVVKVQGLHKRFGALEVLKGVDMDVHRGEVIVIFGRSGSGKSTLLRCINFLEDPTEGTITVAGIELTGGHRTKRKREQIRKLMVGLFTELGPDHPLSKTYRRRLAAALY